MDAAVDAAIAAGAIANAIKATGTIIQVKPEEFGKILLRSKEPLVVVAKSGIIRKNYQYLMGYKGLAFFTQTDQVLSLPGSTELVVADRIWVPDGF